MAEEEDFGGGGGFLELRGFVGEHFSRETVFARYLEGVGVLLLGRVKRKGKDRLALGSRFGRERQESHTVFADERIWRREQDGDVVFGVRGDDGSLHEKWRTIRTANENVGLAAVAETFQDVSGGEEVALLVDEETVAKETVVVAARRWRLIKLINEGADGGKKSGIASLALRRRAHGEDAEDGDE
jgi:hypothetical protein